jgi:hypothetical protein
LRLEHLALVEDHSELLLGPERVEVGRHHGLLVRVRVEAEGARLVLRGKAEVLGGRPLQRLMVRAELLLSAAASLEGQRVVVLGLGDAQLFVFLFDLDLGDLHGFLADVLLRVLFFQLVDY